MSALSLVLLLLGASVLAVVVCRRFNLPPVLGYLLVGSIIGPHALNLMQDVHRAEYLAEFGVVFLMFSIGLEFSLPKLYTMKRIVFGLGLLQVIVSMVLIAGLVMIFGVNWQLGIALGGVFAMSSTAVLTKLLAERMQFDTAHGREIMGVLLFQDLAVVPLLVIIPSLTEPPEKLAMLLGIALLKAVIVLAVILVFGQRLMRKWFHFVARAKSSEVFVLNVLLITLGLATLTELAGLSLALGAFVAGMLISETEYRLQVEEDIKPFRDVLMGLFFVTIGVKLDLHILVGLWWQVLGVLVGLLGLITLLAFVGCAPGTVGEFAIYEPTNAVTAADMDRLALNKIVLAGQPLISSADIVAYWQESHEIQLTPQAFQRMQRLRVPVSGAPFVVCVGRQPIYKGAIWTLLSSLSYDGVVILQPLSADTGIIKIQLGYVAAAKIADPRGDSRVMEALERAGKLKSGTSASEPSQ